TPYDGRSVFAGNPLLISPEMLVRDGLLAKEDLESHPSFPEGRVDYPAVMEYKRTLLDRAYANFKADGAGVSAKGKTKEIRDICGYNRFIADNAFWLDDFALFSAVKSHLHGSIWSEWPEGLRDRHDESLKKMRAELSEEIEKQKFMQYGFFRQWSLLKGYCNGKGIQVIGDMPIYVNYDSSDVWTGPTIFELDENKKPLKVAGVPPDYFSETGQLWGNPIYRWDMLRKEGYAWWLRRIGHNLQLFDMLRIDHFRGLVAYWEVQAGKKTAVEGEWVKVPEDFFNVLFRHFPSMPIIVEDLGFITPDVREIITRFDLPGMKLLLFAFGDGTPANPYAPHNHVKNCVIYTGTHDNNTARGWFEKEMTTDDRRRLFGYLGREVPADMISWELIRMAMMSVADVAILPMQDVLGLGKEARMNRPGQIEGNYQWRLLPEQMKLNPLLKEMTEIYGRA
ncbi:MAG TPA: 4-alpha-glucanotransferase, partial [Methanothrix sp.]|nr:4-alpha-glucanotransferase [Methanothrix sp.]